MLETDSSCNTVNPPLNFSPIRQTLRHGMFRFTVSKVHKTTILLEYFCKKGDITFYLEFAVRANRVHFNVSLVAFCLFSCLKSFINLLIAISFNYLYDYPSELFFYTEKVILTGS